MAPVGDTRVHGWRGRPVTTGGLRRATAAATAVVDGRTRRATKAASGCAPSGPGRQVVAVPVVVVGVVAVDAGQLERRSISAWTIIWSA